MLKYNTELLTHRGWKFIQNLSANDIIYTTINGVDIVPVNYSVISPYEVTDESFIDAFYDNTSMMLSASINSKIFWRGTKNRQYKLRSLNDLAKLAENCAASTPMTFNKVGEIDNLSDIDRFRIAAQADGSISHRYSGIFCGTLPWSFFFSKSRKIDRFKCILNALQFKFTETVKPSVGNKSAGLLFCVNVPVEYSISKNLKDWVDLKLVSSSWCEDFVSEVVNWDGHTKSDGGLYYSSIIKDNIDTVQSVSVFTKYSSTVGKQVDDRKETFSDVWRLFMSTKSYRTFGGIAFSSNIYSGLAYKSNIDTSFIVRCNSKVGCVNIN